MRVSALVHGSLCGYTGNFTIARIGMRVVGSSSVIVVSNANDAAMQIQIVRWRYVMKRWWCFLTGCKDYD
ncbi:MAG TPA: hypothetical protein VN703_05260 [Candidatus Sulfopaludibacter sp.]|nr:hypothetical protein [Candidatus Sulfopaludibacter sp.]